MYDHGRSVRAWYVDLRDYITLGSSLQGNWRLPPWISSQTIRDSIRSLDDRIMELYQVFHDCGKPFCLEIDSQGRRHFPRHEIISKERWLSLSDGSPEALAVGELIGMDMDIHRMKACGLTEFMARPQAIALLCTGLSELHSNAQMFGGIGSPGFKMKFKNMDRFGARIVGNEGE